MEEEEPEFETGEEFSLGMEEPETEEEPIPETEEEPEENFTRSGGRRASNLGRNREVASKEIPAGNKLAESKLQESINIDKFLLDVDDIEHETMSAIGTDEGVENHYADGYKAGMDMVRLIADEDRQFPDDLVNDLEKKQSEIYTDYESLEDEEAQRMGIDDDYCEGWYQAFEDVLEKFGAGTITPDKKEESKLTEAPTEEDEEFKKLCAEIEFQADENDFTLSKEDVKGIAKKMIADKFFFNHDIFADEDDEEAWEEINDLIVSAIEAYPNKVDESKEIKKEAKGFITVGNKRYGINSALTMINNIYDILYDSEKELDNIFPFGIGTYTDEGDKLIKEKDPQVTKLISARGDAFTSDREATALGMFFSGLTNQALTSMLISNASKTESKEIKTETVELDEIENENDLAEYIADHYEEITGVDVRELFNKEEYENPDEPIFNQDIIDETSPAVEKFIIKYNTENGTDFDFYNEDLLDLIDEKLLNVKVALGESKEVKTEKKIVIDNMGETYTIDTDAKTYTVKTEKGEKTFTFDEMDNFVKQARGVNRIYKPFSLLAYTDFKHGGLKNWDIKTEGVDNTKVQDTNSVVFTLDLKGEPEDISGGFESVDICIKGTNTLTTMIKKAITSRFAGIFKSDITGKVYSQDIPVADDLWLTFLDFDEATNTLNFVLDGDVSKDKELVDNKKEESVTSKEYDDILLAIDQADSMEELQDIIYAVSDGVVEDEMQDMYNACKQDKDDLDTVKDMLTAIFEDNTDIEE